MHNTAVSVNVKINAPIANGTAIGALCIRTHRLSYRYDSYRPVRAYRNNKVGQIGAPCIRALVAPMDYLLCVSVSLCVSVFWR